MLPRRALFRCHRTRFRGSPPAQHRTDPGRASVPSQPSPPEPLGNRRICALVAPFEIPSSFRHSAAPSDSTILQDQSENHHTSLAGSIMMIADAALLKARAADVSCAQLGSATRARDTVRSPGRCSFNDMHLFSTPLYITRQAAACGPRIIIFCHACTKAVGLTACPIIILSHRARKVYSMNRMTIFKYPKIN